MNDIEERKNHIRALLALLGAMVNNVRYEDVENPSDFPVITMEERNEALALPRKVERALKLGMEDRIEYLDLLIVHIREVVENFVEALLPYVDVMGLVGYINLKHYSYFLTREKREGCVFLLNTFLNAPESVDKMFLAPMLEYKYSLMGMVRNPGKFEGEPPFVIYYHEIGMHGFADETHDNLLVFDVRDEDRVMFSAHLSDMSIKQVGLYYREDGFVECIPNPLVDDEYEEVEYDGSDY